MACFSRKHSSRSKFPISEFLSKWKAETLQIRCRYKKTVPQLLIRWSVQKNFITIPKSSKPERIQENADIFNFTISDEDMKTLVSFIKLHFNPPPPTLGR